MNAAGRRDWDYVIFADYARDMDELTQRGRAIAEQQRHEIAGLKRTIWLLVQAAGGRVDLEPLAECAFDKKTAELITLRRTEDLDALTIIARTKP